MISGTILWFVAALIVAGAEMVLGTSYLIAVALGAAAGGAASFFGASLEAQIALCALVIVAAAFLFRRLRAARAGEADRAGELQRLDEGKLVRVEAVGADGLAVVQDRGAPWIARPGKKAIRHGHWTLERDDGVQLELRHIER